jgi:hypothetical protein
MPTTYRKSLKGTEEIAMRTYGLSMRLRPYLLIVDGARSLEELIREHPGLPEVEMVFKSLLDSGFIELATSQSAQANMSNANIVNLQRTANGAPPMPMRAPPAEIMEQPVQRQAAQPTAQQNGQKIDYLKGQMIQEVSALLGKDAALVVSKIQNCKTGDDLFATLMGLKKIITMYAGAEQADTFVRKFSELAMM